jgi:hypothetical protein
MSYSFYFLIGQVITFLGISWQTTLCFNLLLIIIIDLFQWSIETQLFALLLGWASTVFVSNYLLRSRRILSFVTVSSQILFLIYIIEVIVFAILTSIIYHDDSNPFLWGLLIVFHSIFILCVTGLDSKLEKKPDMYDDNRYDVIFGVCILSSDLTFLLLSLSNWINSSTFFSTLCVAPISFLSAFGIYCFLRGNNPIEV